MQDHLRITKDADGLAVVTFDMAERSANMLTRASMAEFMAKMSALLEDDDVTGVVIASAKAQFHVGFDLETALELRQQSAASIFEELMQGNDFLRRMETSGKPVVAAITGHCMGGGFEIALACHARIVADDPKIKLGLPETKIGLIPGFGGAQRLARLMKLEDVVPLIASGGSLRPDKALKKGAVTELVSKELCLEHAKEWARANPKAKQPWDERSFRLPSGSFYSPNNLQFFAGTNGNLRKNTFGNYAAPPSAVAGLYHGLQLPLDQALKIDARRFVHALKSRQAEVMIRTLFFGMNAANDLERRPPGIASKVIEHIAVVGAGLMGAGIAYSAAKAGLQVVLIDTDLASAERGKSYAQKVVEKRRKAGRMDADTGEVLLARIHPRADYAELANCELAIEAVFEDATVKRGVFAKLEAALSEAAIIASNTSTIPISQLAQSLQHPERFVGLHFFSPVEKMPLVEIISGEATSVETLAHAFDAVRALGKTPIDVRDGRGFYTTRVCSAYFLEGMSMLTEGISPAIIDNAGKNAGMPMGPLRLGDMVNLDLVVKIADQSKADLGDAYIESSGIQAARKLCDLGRLGEKVGKGLYDHEAGQARLWAGLSELFPTTLSDIDPGDVGKRLLDIQALEMLRCLEEGILKTPEDADIGSILGWGFAPFTGGIASYVDTLTPKVLLERALHWQDAHGERFAPPEILKRMADEGRLLYPA